MFRKKSLSARLKKIMVHDETLWGYHQIDKITKEPPFCQIWPGAPIRINDQSAIVTPGEPGTFTDLHQATIDQAPK